MFEITINKFNKSSLLSCIFRIILLLNFFFKLQYVNWIENSLFHPIF